MERTRWTRKTTPRKVEGTRSTGASARIRSFFDQFNIPGLMGRTIEAPETEVMESKNAVSLGGTAPKKPRTLLTSPSGVQGNATVGTKTLLGG